VEGRGSTVVGVASRWLDRLVLGAARGVVDAVRYEPRQLDLVLACGVSELGARAPAVRWLAEARARPAVVKAWGLPHAAVRALAEQAGHWFGPTASAVVRWSAGALSRVMDRSVSLALERPLRAHAHPGMLVPHPHAIAVLAADMRGFSHLTRELRDTQYLADLVGEYLTELTRIVERHRGVVFHYAGDGLLALFLPELMAMSADAMLDRLVHDTAAELHAAFDVLHERWRRDWQASDRVGADVGLGLGLSFGRATIGFIGPAGKKQFGVIGEPVNLAAFLCSQAHAGTILVDCGSFIRAAAGPPATKVVRLHAKKRHHRIRAFSFRYGARRRAPLRDQAVTDSTR
jgi:class 3 adenylate cyclase